MLERRNVTSYWASGKAFPRKWYYIEEPNNETWRDKLGKDVLSRGNMYQGNMYVEQHVLQQERAQRGRVVQSEDGGRPCTLRFYPEGNEKPLKGCKQTWIIKRPTLVAVRIVWREHNGFSENWSENYSKERTEDCELGQDNSSKDWEQQIPLCPFLPNWTWTQWLIT